MNPDIQKLYDIAAKPERIILGLMSGTSVDGLDLALCRCTGSGPGTKIEVLHFETVPYDTIFREHIASVFAKKEADLEQLTLLNAWVAKQHAALINECLKKWNVNKEAVDLIASHGQTIYHAPKTLHGLEAFGNATLQIGDGDHIAVQTGIITISDFRQKHIAAGGEGAPLAVYGDHLIFGSETENRIMLNMGGIANFTWLPAGSAVQQILSTDTGPGNTIMDAYVKKYFNGMPYDEDGNIAGSGQTNNGLLYALLDDPFFSLPLPKTTGPEKFNLEYLEAAMERSATLTLPMPDVMATLNTFTATAIASAIKKVCDTVQPATLFCSGGGTHNKTLISSLQTLLPFCRFEDTGALGIDPDAKEAVLFALLANECVAGTIAEAGGTGFIPVKMGKISLPH